MKRFALVSAVIAVAVLALFATSAAQSTDEDILESQAGVRYDAWDFEHEGVLSVANAEGNFIEVFAADGELVWCGHVPEAHFEIVCPNNGEGEEGNVLRVCTSSGLMLCIDRDTDWIWE